MGTPHLGVDSAKVASALANIASPFMRVRKDILKNLEPDSDWLQNQLRQYNPISGLFVTKYAYEEEETRVAGYLSS
jgi:hypothetical protein